MYYPATELAGSSSFLPFKQLTASLAQARTSKLLQSDLLTHLFVLFRKPEFSRKFSK